MSEQEQPQDPTARRSRRRGDDLIQAIHAAVLAEVAEVGVGGLTMEGIAKRAATAKTSLYRRWPSPRELLLDALYEAHPEELPSPGANDLRGDLIRALQQLVAWMVQPAGLAVMAIMSERQRHPDLVKALYDRVFDARGSTVTYTVLRHYAEQGQIDPALITPVVRDIGEALVFKHVTDADQLPGDHELAAIVDQAILPAIGIPPRREQRSPTRLGLVTVVVEDQDQAIRYFADALGFEVAEDSGAVTNDGHAKRWVVVRPPGAETGILLAEAADEDQRRVIGAQLAGRVGFFLHVNDFAAQYSRMAAAGVQFDEEPRTEPYGQVVVFTDIAGNKWDLLGPAT